MRLLTRLAHYVAAYVCISRVAWAYIVRDDYRRAAGWFALAIAHIATAKIAVED